jgi:hypothetical protein
MALGTILMICGGLLAVCFGGWFSLGLCVAASRGEGNYGDAQ